MTQWQKKFHILVKYQVIISHAFFPDVLSSFIILKLQIYGIIILMSSKGISWKVNMTFTNAIPQIIKLTVLVILIHYLFW